MAIKRNKRFGDIKQITENDKNVAIANFVEYDKIDNEYDKIDNENYEDVSYLFSTYEG